MEHKWRAICREIEATDAIAAAHCMAIAWYVCHETGWEFEQRYVGRTAHAQRVAQKDVVPKPHVEITGISLPQEHAACARFVHRERGANRAVVSRVVETRSDGLCDGSGDQDRLSVPSSKRRRHYQ
jgi:hypothetical protein